MNKQEVENLIRKITTEQLVKHKIIEACHLINEYQITYVGYIVAYEDEIHITIDIKNQSAQLITAKICDIKILSINEVKNYLIKELKLEIVRVGVGRF